MRTKALVQGIYAGLTVLVTLSLLLAMLEISHLDRRVNALGTQVQADRDAARGLNDQISALTATITADKQTIASKNTEIVRLGGSATSRSTPARSTPTAKATPQPSVVPDPNPLPTPVPTLTCLLGGCG